jgi:quercetin dioxygenase-like cupin family protein
LTGFDSAAFPPKIPAMEIIPADSRKSTRAAADYFTGEVWTDPIVQPAAPARLRALRVTFQPGARTAWHTHPLGQVLHVLSGVGRVQLAGAPAQTIRPGDTVVIAPGERHWHGAAPGHTFVHLAMQNGDSTGTDVVWAGQVTDAEYHAS